MNISRIKLMFYISKRYLKSPKNNKYPSMSTALSFCGVALSVATLIVVISVMNGFVTELISKTLGTNAHLTLSNFGMHGINNYDKITEEISLIKGMKNVYPVINGEGMIINGKNSISSGVVVRGVQENYMKISTLKENLVLHPDCENSVFNGKNGIIVGNGVLNTIGAGIGDTISLVTASLDKTIFGTIPRYKDFFICGVFETGASVYDGSNIFMSFEMGQILFKYKNAASSIEIFLNDYLKSDEIKDFITENNKWNGFISDWKRQNEALFHAMKVERSVMSFILSLFLIVSMFGIFSNMTNAVNSRTKNIAIMQSMGFSASDIKTIFFLSGAMIGILGTIFGCLIGVTFALNIAEIKSFLEGLTGSNLFSGAVYFLSYLPSRVEIFDILWIVCISIICTLISSIIPAMRAAKVNVAETLRQL